MADSPAEECRTLYRDLDRYLTGDCRRKRRRARKPLSTRLGVYRMRWISISAKQLCQVALPIDQAALDHLIEANTRIDAGFPF